MMGCFFAVYRNGNSPHSFGHVQLHHHQVVILVPLATIILKDVDFPACITLSELLVMNRYHVYWPSVLLRRSVGFFMVVRIRPFLVVISRLSRCTMFQSYVPIKKSKVGSGVVVDIAVHEVCWLQDIPFASVMSCEAV